MNPILQNLNQSMNGGLMNLIQMAKGDPQGMFKQMMSNPQFAQFVNENRGKSADQIAQEHGIDRNMLHSLLGK